MSYKPHPLLVHNINGEVVGEVEGGFIAPLLAGLAGLLLPKLFGSGTYISHAGVAAKPKKMSVAQIAKMLKSGHGTDGCGPKRKTKGHGAMGFGDGGAVGFGDGGAMGFGIQPNKPRMHKRGGDAVDQTTWYQYEPSKNSRVPLPVIQM